MLQLGKPLQSHIVCSSGTTHRHPRRSGSLRSYFCVPIGVDVNPELSDMRMKHWGCCVRRSELVSKVYLAFEVRRLFFAAAATPNASKPKGHEALKLESAIPKSENRSNGGGQIGESKSKFTHRGPERKLPVMSP